MWNRPRQRTAESPTHWHSQMGQRCRKPGSGKWERPRTGRSWTEAPIQPAPSHPPGRSPLTVPLALVLGPVVGALSWRRPQSSPPRGSLPPSSGLSGDFVTQGLPYRPVQPPAPSLLAPSPSLSSSPKSLVHRSPLGKSGTPLLLSHLADSEGSVCSVAGAGQRARTCFYKKSSVTPRKSPCPSPGGSVWSGGRAQPWEAASAAGAVGACGTQAGPPQPATCGGWAGVFPLHPGAGGPPVTAAPRTVGARGGSLGPCGCAHPALRGASLTPHPRPHREAELLATLMADVFLPRCPNPSPDLTAGFPPVGGKVCGFSSWGVSGFIFHSPVETIVSDLCTVGSRCSNRT